MAPLNSSEKKGRAGKILRLLGERFPVAEYPKTALYHKNPLELLVATILSAQCTDERVNKTTPALFKRYRSAAAYGAALPAELKGLISSINFFQTKAGYIRRAAAIIESEFSGKVPRTIDELTTLPGVGRKTANVVLAVAFGEAALAVDTHVSRVARRLGLAASKDPDRIEEELCLLLPEGLRSETTRLFIYHGRSICGARRPLCGECHLELLCRWPEKNGHKDGKKA